MATVPSPRLSEGHVDANDVIPSEDDDLPQVLAYYVAIPLSLAVFITVLVVLLCMRKEHVAIDERRQTIDVEGQWTSSNPQRPGHKPEVQQKRTQNGSVNPAYETHQENAPAPSARPIVENESNGNAQRDDVDASGRKTPLMPPTGKNANVQKEDRSFIEDKYGLPPTPKPPQRNHVEKPRSSTDHLVRPRGRPTGLSYDSAQHAQMVASLDASPAFQRLKYGTQRSSTLRRSHKYGENDVQLSRFRTLRTDFNDGIEVGNPRRSTQHRARYHTLDMSSRTSRRSQRSREAEQEWARKNHLTINKGKKPSRRHSKSFRSSRSAATSMEDLSASGRSSVWSLNVAHETRRRPSNTLSPSPYKLQVQNSIRPNKRVEYRQGIRTKRKTHMLSNSLRRQSTKRKDKSQFGADVSGDSPSFYMGFDVPLPPSNPLDDIPEQMQAKLPRDSDAKTSSLGNGIPTGSNPQVTRLPVPLGERAGDRSVSVKSEHPYEEIRFQKKENQNADADTSEKRHGLAAHAGSSAQKMPLMPPKNNRGKSDASAQEVRHVSASTCVAEGIKEIEDETEKQPTTSTNRNLRPGDGAVWKRTRHKTLRLILSLSSSQRRQINGKTNEGSTKESRKTEIVLGKIVDGYLVPDEGSKAPEYMEFSSHAQPANNVQNRTFVKTEKLLKTTRPVKRRMNSQTLNNFFSNRRHRKAPPAINVPESSGGLGTSSGAITQLPRVNQESDSPVRLFKQLDGSGNIKKGYQHNQRGNFPAKARKKLFRAKKKKKKKIKAQKPSVKPVINILKVEEIDENPYWTIPSQK